MTAVLLAVLTGLGLAALGLRRGWRNMQNRRVLPSRADVDSVQSPALQEQRERLAAALIQDAKTLPAHETELAHHALWMAMLLEAASDENINYREIRFVASLFGQMTETEVAFQTVLDAAEGVLGARETALAEIAKARDISHAAKAHILSGAFLVSLTDRDLADTEADCLGSIADALGLDAEQRKDIYADITERLTV